MSAGKHEVFEHSIGGHALSGGEHAMLVDNEHLLKPFQSRGRGERENSFYELVWGMADEDPTRGTPAPTSTSVKCREQSRQALQQIIPKFFGKKDVDGQSFIEMENKTRHFRLPSIMDVKLGSRGWGVNASEKKVRVEIGKCAEQAKMGFRYIGIKKYDSNGNVRVDEGKTFGKTRVSATKHEGLRLFFSSLLPLPSSPSNSSEEERKQKAEDGIGEVDVKLLKKFRAKVVEMMEIFRKQSMFWFFGASLLVIVESDPSAPVDDDGLPRMEMCLIDFVHSVLVGTDEYERETADVKVVESENRGVRTIGCGSDSDFPSIEDPQNWARMANKVEKTSEVEGCDRHILNSFYCLLEAVDVLLKGNSE